MTEVNFFNKTINLLQALSYAKEAHRLRGKLLQQNFEYSVEKITETCDENGEVFEKSYYGIKTFKANDVMMIKGYCDYEEGCVLTPWNVLRCYLESILQVMMQIFCVNHTCETNVFTTNMIISQFIAFHRLELCTRFLEMDLKLKCFYGGAKMFHNIRACHFLKFHSLPF